MGIYLFGLAQPLAKMHDASLRITVSKAVQVTEPVDRFLQDPAQKKDPAVPFF